MHLTVNKNTEGQCLDVTVHDTSDVANLFHTVELVEGFPLTHGGGEVNKFLRYNQEVVNSDVKSSMAIRSLYVGTTVVRVKAHIYTVTEMEASLSLVQNYTEEELENGIDNEGNWINIPAPTPIELVSDEFEITFDHSKGHLEFI